MSQWSQIKQAWRKLMENPQARDLISSPITKIVAANTAFFVQSLSCRFYGGSKGSPNPYSSSICPSIVLIFGSTATIPCSHTPSRISDSFIIVLPALFLVFDMIIIASFGRGIKAQFGNRMVWWLYLLGAATGALAMQFGMPYTPMVIPQVGADASISAMITFHGLFNLNSTVLLFVFPVRMWVPIWTILDVAGTDGSLLVVRAIQEKLRRNDGWPDCVPAFQS